MPLPRPRRAFTMFLILLAALLALRAVLPSVVKDALNRRLAHLGAYEGRIEDVDLHLWRGAYTLHGVRIVKSGGEVPAPLLDAPTVDLSITWRSLVAGSVVARAEFERPEINFVVSRAESQRQSGLGVNWRERLEDIAPVRLDEVLIHNGTVVLRDFHSSPKVDLRITGVEATVLNLTNVEEEPGSRVASLDAKGRIFDQAPFEAKGKFDPVGRPDSFELSVRALDIDLTRATELTQAYTALDIASGRGDFVMELTAEEGKLRGYAKPLMRDLKLERLEVDDAAKLVNPFALLWKTVAPIVVTLFSNPKEDQFATRVEIRGDLDDRDVDFLGAIGGILRNAFVEAYKPNFESLLKDAKPGDAKHKSGDRGKAKDAKPKKD